MINEKGLKERLIKMSSEERKTYLEELQTAADSASPEERPVKWAQWHVKTARNGDEYEVPIVCTANTEALLAHYGITARYNEMSKDIEIEVPGKDFHRDTALNAKLTWIRDLAQLKSYPKSDISEHVEFIANNHSYHPVKDWIVSKPWDGVSRLEQFYATVSSETEMKALYMKKWGVMAVAAIFNPEGIRPQGILTFEGAQGGGKTSWLASVVGNPKWIGEGQALDPDNKDSVLDVVSKWIVELGEIQATFTRADIQSLKAFITKNEDRIRPPYAAKVNTYARKTVFFGTVDEKNFLADKNGTRRFWTISVSAVNLDHGIDTQQLWAEFYEVYKTGFNWWMGKDEIASVNASNDDYMVIDPIEQLLDEHCKVAAEGEPVTEYEWLNATKILMRFGKATSKTDLNTVAKWLKKKNARYKREHRQFLVAVDTLNKDGKTHYGEGN